MVALYSELEQKAEQLRSASDMKSRFLSNMSHEFRTPLNSILALSRLLIDGIDGELNAEQMRQVDYIRKAAQGLLEMVNDLLDLAKVEAGKLDVRPAALQHRRPVREPARLAAAAAGQPGGRADLRRARRACPRSWPTSRRWRRSCAT